MITKRFNVSKISDSAVQKFCFEMERMIQTTWSSTATLEDKWSCLRCSLLESARKVLGTDKNNALIGFLALAVPFNLSINNRNEALPRWLSTRKQAERDRFVSNRKLVQREVRCARNSRYRFLGIQISHKPKDMWECVKHMQHNKSGLLPLQIIKIWQKIVPCVKLLRTD